MLSRYRQCWVANKELCHRTPRSRVPGEELQGAREAEINDFSPFAGLIQPSLFQQQQPELAFPTKGSSALQWLSASRPLSQQGFGIPSQSLKNIPKVTPAAWCPNLA